MSNLSKEFILPRTSNGVAATASSARENGAKVARLAPCVMLALALIGIADASYDAYAIYNSQPLWCPPPINGCNEVAGSPYARIFDLPLGYYGAVYYLDMLGLAVLLGFDPLSRGLRLGVLLYAAAGVLFSIYFLFLEIFFIHAVCIYCLVSAATTVLLALAAVTHFKVTRVPVVPEYAPLRRCAIDLYQRIRSIHLGTLT